MTVRYLFLHDVSFYLDPQVGPSYCQPECMSTFSPNLRILFQTARWPDSRYILSWYSDRVCAFGFWVRLHTRLHSHTIVQRLVQKEVIRRVRPHASQLSSYVWKPIKGLLLLIIILLDVDKSSFEKPLVWKQGPFALNIVTFCTKKRCPLVAKRAGRLYLEKCPISRPFKVVESLGRGLGRLEKALCVCPRRIDQKSDVVIKSQRG